MPCAVAVMPAKFPLELEQQVAYAFLLFKFLMKELTYLPTSYQKAVIGILLKEKNMLQRIKRRKGLVPFCAVLTLYLFHLFLYPFVKLARWI